MTANATYLSTRLKIEQMRLSDALSRARQQLPQLPSDVHAQLQQTLRSDPSHPANWHAQAVARAMNTPRVQQMYFSIRRSLWLWEEFADLPPGARAVLEAVIELAREEAFPWYTMVPAHQVQRIARLSEGGFSVAAQRLDCLSITRPASIITSETFNPAAATTDAWQACESCDLPPVAQWVVRYRRGVPWHASRAAWWINYDLLCRTGRVLDCFVTSMFTLSRTFRYRKTPMGRLWPSMKSDAGVAAMIRMLQQRGPLPPFGLRATLWGEKNTSSLSDNPRFLHSIPRLESPPTSV